MKSIVRHVLLPSIMSVLFFAVVSIPIEMIGCRTRGLLAFAIALISVLAGLAAAIMAVRGKVKGDRKSAWWILTALILAVPAVALLILA